ncbi:MAG: uracil phosphoribosyltransferase [Gammaproteobacteria bacterium]
MSQLIQLVHPIADESLLALRDKTLSMADFRRHSQRVSRMLLLEATRTLPQQSVTVDTPLEAVTGERCAEPVVFVPVLRAGLAMLFAGMELIPDARVGFVGLERDEATAKASEYYCKLPDDLEHSRVCVIDPMLATGGSMSDTLSSIKRAGGKNISAVCIVAAPEGIARLQEEHDDVTIVTAAVDRELDANKYIRPGLGDYGDRYFGTV